MKNKFFTHELVHVANIEPKAQSLQVVRKAWVLI